jgi:class 3 adenylate cyclase
MTAIRDWLAGLGLEEHAEAFEANAIGLDHLGDLDHALLKEIGVAAVGHRVDILKAAQAPAPAPAQTREAERRQITVMFCDLVGSTALSEKLDPEDLRTLMQGYQQAAGRVIERYGGHVAQYLGDGLMTYFGWPQAHEDDAERAVRASLDIVDAVNAMELHVRIGIATGPVVVGETGAGDASVPKLAVGETPNLAARLQGLAGPDEIIVSPSTRRLLGGTFVLADMGAQALKGIVEPVPAHRVTGLAATEGRFEAHRQHLTPLVGREAEMAMVMARWQQTCAGEGQVIVLSGEPGIGKSRITQALRERLAEEPHTRLRYQCSPYHMNSALHPVIEQIERAANFERDDTIERKLDKLETLLPNGAGRALVASLLSLPTDRYPALAMSPQKQKEETLRVLAEGIVTLAAAAPVLLVFEDAHWIDPTSQELLDILVPMVTGHGVLAVITHRPEYQPPWLGQGHVTPLALTRLGRADAAAMVARVSDTPLPDDVLDQIVARCDGVPLFVEELTKTVAEGSSGTVPETLQDSLMARLDRLGPVKEIAQIGACIGRAFSRDLLMAVSVLTESALAEALQELIDSELINLSSSGYTFKHALLQDAAYESLLKTTRQQHHAAIAEALQTRFADYAANEPELVAHHYTKAGLVEQAVPLWLRAGEQAVARFANREAISHLNAGLDLLSHLPESELRARHELSLRLALGPALMVEEKVIGSGVEANFRAMLSVSEKLADTTGLAAAFLGLHRYFVMSGDLPRVHEQDVKNFRLAESIGDKRLLRTAHWGLGASQIWRGELIAASEHSRNAYGGLTFADDQSFIATHLEAPGVTCRCFAAWAAISLGYPDSAMALLGEALNLAERLDHPYQIILAQAFSSVIHHMRREPRECLRAANDLATLCEDNEVPVFAPIAAITGAWAGLALRQESGVAALGRAREAMSNLVPLWQPVWCLPVFECELTHGSAADATRRMDEVLNWVEERTVRLVEAELRRLRGELALAAPGADAAEAETWFQDALAVARRQQAKWWELRAATSLARLWQSQGKAAQARDLLAPVHAWFTEGFDTADLIEAKALLDTL